MGDDAPGMKDADMTYVSPVKTLAYQPKKDDPGPKPEPKVEKIPEIETLSVPAALLLACEAISPQKDVGRAHLQGVYLTARNGRGHAVATDGCRMFIGTFPLPNGTPSWLKGGVTVSNDGLKARASLLLKLEESTNIVLSYAKGAPCLEMSDRDRHANFRMNLVDGQFPDYENVLASIQSFGVLDDDGQITAKEWQLRDSHI